MRSFAKSPDQGSMQSACLSIAQAFISLKFINKVSSELKFRKFLDKQ
jgi:hypothetical protein